MVDSAWLSPVPHRQGSAASSDRSHPVYRGSSFLPPEVFLTRIRIQGFAKPVRPVLSHALPSLSKLLKLKKKLQVNNGKTSAG